MRSVIVAFSWLITLSPCALFSQEYSYAHYGLADGLASSTVYCITQDRDGFIWTGTEAGVCRFDGSHFVTYTTADGLPDAEILQLFGDSKGRVWMAPFRGSMCYFFHGKIHNQGNDSLLSAIGSREEVENFVEDIHGDILIQQRTSLTVVGPDGSVKRYDSAGGVPIRRSYGAGPSAGGNFNVQIDEQLFELSANGFRPFEKISFPDNHPNFIAFSPGFFVWKPRSYEDRLSSLTTNQSASYSRDFPVNHHVSFSIVGDSLVCINELDGVEEISLSHNGVLRKFLPGIHVSRTFGDKAGNIWFTTIGNGIYRLKSEEARSVILPEDGLGVAAVSSIEPSLSGDNLLLGVNHHTIYRMSFPACKLVAKLMRTLGQSRILFAHEFKDNWLVYGTDANLVVGSFGQLDHLQVGDGIKSASLVDDDHVLVGGPWGAGIFDIQSRRISDTIWRSRITVVFSRRDTNYVGTLHGLWRMIGKSPAEFMGNSASFLRNRISAISESDDGTLWVASNADSVIGFANGRVIATISSDQGLTGNVTHCLYYHDQALWLGTDKGLNKIELDKPGYPATSYSSKDGLGSDVVNVVYGAGKTIFVGTSAGLSFFDETRMRTGDECRLNLISVINSGKEKIGDTANLSLSYRAKDIRLDFVGISYRSAGNIRYRYRMMGLDSNWRETNATFLEFPSLPSGGYVFQLQATNKFGVRSSMLSLPFQVETPYWEAIWFRGLAVGIVALLIWLLVTWRIRLVRRQQNERGELIKQRAEMENKALQAQMNPHFIFNCLNSIQQFFFEGDEIAVNNYISGFSRLIRATLHNSSQQFISVADEVDYLRTYLSLEKMRFKDKMEYFVEVDPAIDQEKNMLPPMLIQPYVENCMRHGLRHKSGGSGYIVISMRQADGRLLVVVEDNGIGRKKALEYKTREHIEYQSRGMTMTAERLKVISAIYGGEVNVKVEDVIDKEGNAAGTRILISLPEFRHWTAEPA